MKKSKSDLNDVANVFLKLGLTAFGGPAAHIAMMRQEVVLKRQWITEQHFLDLIGATNLIPGPNSTEMAIHIGQERGGWRGLLLAGGCFIIPGVLITGCFAALYKTYGLLPRVQPFLYGIKPAIIAVIIAAIYPLARKSVQNFVTAIIGASALVLALLGYSEIMILFGAGFTAMCIAAINGRKQGSVKSFFPVLLAGSTAQGFLSSANAKLFLSFLKIGAILYGSGYVLFAFLDSELVPTGIITRQQLADAIAVGQFTPGPVFSSVTFIGYQVGGIGGAITATLGIFLPSFLFVALLNPFVRKLRGSVLFAAFLNAVNAASIALILVVCYQLGKDSLTSWREITIALISTVILFRFKEINSAFIIWGGALAGYFLSLL